MGRVSRVLRFDSNGEPFLGDPDDKIIAFHPRVSPLINLYEIVDEKGVAIWGGNSANEAIEYLRRSPINCRVLVSGWESDEEDAHLVGQSLDITKVIYAALAVGL
jgi:hypothetical protein